MTRKTDSSDGFTAEERADAALAQAQQEVDAAAADTRKRTEQAMLSTYATEDDLRRVFSERTAIVDNNIKTAAYNVASLREALATQLQVAGNKELSGKKVNIQRSKGLGENDPEMMWLTTMNPESRRLIKVLPTDVEETARVFDLLLGDNLAGRKEHIAQHGAEYLDDLDVS